MDQQKAREIKSQLADYARELAERSGAVIEARTCPTPRRPCAPHARDRARPARRRRVRDRGPVPPRRAHRAQHRAQGRLGGGRHGGRAAHGTHPSARRRAGRRACLGRRPGRAPARRHRVRDRRDGPRPTAAARGLRRARGRHRGDARGVRARRAAGGRRRRRGVGLRAVQLARARRLAVRAGGDVVVQPGPADGGRAPTTAWAPSPGWSRWRPGSRRPWTPRWPCSTTRRSTPSTRSGASRRRRSRWAVRSWASPAGPRASPRAGSRRSSSTTSSWVRRRARRAAVRRPDRGRVHGRRALLARGDSGSLVYREDGVALGLLFAGSETGGANGTGLTYCNPIGTVLERLGRRCSADPARLGPGGPEGSAHSTPRGGTLGPAPGRRRAHNGCGRWLPWRPSNEPGRPRPRCATSSRASTA